MLPVGINVEALPDGHVLSRFIRANKVMEIDDDGKTVWEIDDAAADLRAAAANGHTLVGSRLDMTVVELDHDGKEVKTMKLESRVFRAGGR